MAKISFVITLALFPCLLACVRSKPVVAATLILRNAHIWTVDENNPVAQAVAVLQDRILYVGSDEEVRKLAGPETVVLDLKGKTVLPGFIDAHVHFTQGGMNLLSVQLRDASSPQEFSQRIMEFVRRRSPGEWILGGDWDHELWPGAPLPTRALVDSVTPENPLFLNRLDGHMALANTRALQLAGVTRKTSDPNGGAIVRDAAGEPTGILKDAAMSLVEKIIPPPSRDGLRRAVLAALAEARRFGVTSVQDMTSPEELAVYQDLLQSSELTARITSRTPLPDYRQLMDRGIRAGFGGDWLRLGCLKGFADGSLGSSTALFFEPYAGAPGLKGLPAPMMFPEGNMLRMVREADAAGLQVSVHAIGDRANSIVLDIFEDAGRHNAKWDRRFRIEHAQHLRAADIPRFRQSGVIASVQPYHAADDGRWAEKRIGKERLKTTYAFRSLLDAGVRLAFGSDWFVAPLNPLLGIHAAVTRQTLDGKNPEGWVPEQKISVSEAIHAYTYGAAYAAFEENIKGRIMPGMLADMAVLSQNILTIPPPQIEKTEVLYTIVGGRIVYGKPLENQP